MTTEAKKPKLSRDMSIVVHHLTKRRGLLLERKAKIEREIQRLDASLLPLMEDQEEEA